MAKKKKEKKDITAKTFTVKKMLAALDGPANVLGNSRAVTIACHCGNTVMGNLPRTLAQLGINGIPFQVCVAQSVRNAGFTIVANTIPNTPANTLLDVVSVIQNAPSK